MLDVALASAAALYGAAILRAWACDRLEDSPYASPAEADAQLDALPAAHPALAREERYGSTGVRCGCCAWGARRPLRGSS